MHQQPIRLPDRLMEQRLVETTARLAARPRGFDADDHLRRDELGDERPHAAALIRRPRAERLGCQETSDRRREARPLRIDVEGERRTEILWPDRTDETVGDRVENRFV